ncbi:hypothetical protein BUALT_Bualt01G0122000 [Buddleja alternifolia]|uniref:AMMECR1 domain-containing protein n=1 Tax=Buddleja alternifolia TaxID=168488 RepID=A0AAV6YCF7_9LAMI|nr:hypothetical protein BUALT_Bualt01G0122000 [Buddleja alternifolia]
MTYTRSTSDKENLVEKLKEQLSVMSEDQRLLQDQVGKHGIIIEFTDPTYNTKRSATYLPEVAAHEGWTKIEAIDSLMRKAGYNGTITEQLRKRIELTRYQSTLFTMSYGDYVAYVKTIRGAAPTINGAKPGNY